MSGLERRLEALARTPVLLVASDYDGTLAPIVADPADARPLPGAVAALGRLAALPRTHAAVISGRSLRDLTSLLGAPEPLLLVGSHGSEFDAGFARSLPPEVLALRDRVHAALAAIAAGAPGTRLEDKPASVALHYREAPGVADEELLRWVARGPGALPGVYTRHGKKVVELCVLGTHKGSALERLRAGAGATGACFVGDDVTDEDAFAALGAGDVAIKVGPGPSRAAWRVPDPEAVVALLARLAARRAAWLAGAAEPGADRNTRPGEG